MNRGSKLRAAGVLLVSTLVALAAACGSSSGNGIVFVSNIDGDGEVYLLNADNGEATPLTTLEPHPVPTIIFE